MCAPGSCVSRKDYYAVLDRRDDREVALRNRIAELEADRLALIRQIDAVVWNFEHGTVTEAEHERAWRNVLASALPK